MRLASSAHEFFKKIVLLIINLIFNNSLFFKLFGLLNKKFNLIQKFFVSYPANQSYLDAYIFKFYKNKTQWKPFIIGIFKQNNKYGLMTGISNVENDFVKSNIEKMKLLIENVDKATRLLAIQQVSFAGILPSILLVFKLFNDEGKFITIKSILKSINRIKIKYNLDNKTPIILLGGKGLIGRNLKNSLNGHDIYIVDKPDKNESVNFSDWPNHLENRKVILINISRNSILKDYIELLWKEIIVINEVYPEPSAEEISQLKSKEINCYHIVGVKAKALPKFPMAYNGGIPCCAAINENEFEVLLNKLN